MGTLTTTIARGLYNLEIRAPRFKLLSEMIASLSSSVTSELAKMRQWSLFCSSPWTGPDSNKKNCWEYSGCCKETHGRYANMLGVCPAALESRLDGIHGGRNGGRACWVVSNTHCHGSVQESYEQKKKTCSQCGFYRSVQWEEASSFIKNDDLLLKFLQ